MISNPEALRDLLQQREVVSAAETPLPAYSVQIVNGVADNLAAIDGLLAQHAKVKGLDRLPGVDLAILRVATWEIIGNSDVDDVIAIDEAVAIAKSISTEKSPAFVNAVLDAVHRDFRSGQERPQKLPPDGGNYNANDNLMIDQGLDELLDEY